MRGMYVGTRDIFAESGIDNARQRLSYSSPEGGKETKWRGCEEPTLGGAKYSAEGHKRRASVITAGQ